MLLFACDFSNSHRAHQLQKFSCLESDRQIQSSAGSLQINTVFLGEYSACMPETCINSKTCHWLQSSSQKTLARKNFCVEQNIVFLEYVGALALDR